MERSYSVTPVSNSPEQIEMQSTINSVILKHGKTTSISPEQIETMLSNINSVLLKQGKIAKIEIDTSDGKKQFLPSELRFQGATEHDVYQQLTDIVRLTCFEVLGSDIDLAPEDYKRVTVTYRDGESIRDSVVRYEGVCEDLYVGTYSIIYVS